MKTQARSGFTIIEVMLFLAVTGALTVAILVGSGVAIGQQRYRDSVNSFKSLIQQQYGLIGNVVNSEADQPDCVQSGDSLLFDDSTLRSRGTSDCLVAGRFLFINGSQVLTYDVLAQPPVGQLPTSDSSALASHALSIHSLEEYQVNWGAKIVEPESGNDSVVSVLIARSPISGSTLTYVLDGDHRSYVKPMISDANMTAKTFCVESSGSSAVSVRLAVRIAARAANQSAVEIPLEKDGVCG